MGPADMHPLLRGVPWRPPHLLALPLLSGCPPQHQARPAYSQMMAIRELKLPMLKHSRATSMKNSITCALCFFLAGWGQGTRVSAMTHPLLAWPGPH